MVHRRSEETEETSLDLNRRSTVVFDTLHPPPRRYPDGNTPSSTGVSSLVRRPLTRFRSTTHRLFVPHVVTILTSAPVQSDHPLRSPVTRTTFFLVSRVGTRDSPLRSSPGLLLGFRREKERVLGREVVSSYVLEGG